MSDRLRLVVYSVNNGSTARRTLEWGKLISARVKLERSWGNLRHRSIV